MSTHTFAVPYTTEVLRVCCNTLQSSQARHDLCSESAIETMPLAALTDHPQQCCCSPQEETWYSDNDPAEEYNIIRTKAAVHSFGHQQHQHHLFLSNAHVDPRFSEAWLQLDCLLVAPHALRNVPQAGMALPPQVPGLHIPGAQLCSSLQHAKWIKLGP